MDGETEIRTAEQLMVAEYIDMKGTLKTLKSKYESLEREVNNMKEKYDVLRTALDCLGITKTDKLITVKHTVFGKSDDGYKDLDDYLFRKEQLGEFDDHSGD